MLVSIELTPVAGIPIFIEGESNTAETPPATTGQNGIASQSVNRSDTLSIYSGLPAVEFTPIVGSALALSSAGTIEISARRLVTTKRLCRFLAADNEDTLAFYFSSIAAGPLEVQSGGLANSIRTGDDILTRTQPSDRFEPGDGFFTVPLAEFVTASGPGQCITGKWHLLGSELSFQCAPGEFEPDIPMCEARATLLCPRFNSTNVQFVRNRALKYVARAQRFQRNLIRRYPDLKRDVFVAQGMQKWLVRFNEVLTHAEEISRGCSDSNPQCREVEFPKQELRQALDRSFKRRPKRQRHQFREMRSRITREFDIDLRRFSDFLVQCD